MAALLDLLLGLAGIVGAIITFTGAFNTVKDAIDRLIAYLKSLKGE